ncbi:hypothetical protein CPB84DRAFT_1856810 [Gymnopilus junonius]|uniref:Uncharacterized protein n=1 Tax=Gymnopilus junonius TaxID=109634 RepID=A0A9P5N6S8_GYMJU|nr:hypothetical protein CPB84DRAFT_1856810 [Gymnopilus junonius]
MSLLHFSLIVLSTMFYHAECYAAERYSALNISQIGFMVPMQEDAAPLTVPNSKSSPSSCSSSPHSSPKGLQSQSQDQSKKKKNASSPSSQDHHDVPSFPGSSEDPMSSSFPLLFPTHFSPSASASIDTFSSSEDEPSPSHKTSLQMGLSMGNNLSPNLSTTLFSAPTLSWGATSRLMSIMMFLMLVYKVLS